MHPEVPSLAQYDFVSDALVTWLQSVGARVVPLSMAQGTDRVRALLHQVNGVVVPGGCLEAVQGSDLWRFIEFVFREVLRLNDAGHHMPMWGSCLGFQFFVAIVAGTDHVLSPVSGCWNKVCALEMGEPWGSCRLHNSLLLAGNHKVAHYFIHNNGVLLEAFASNPRLQAFFRVVSTNRDGHGRLYVSTVEGRHYPIYGAQWHPERAPSPEAKIVAHQVARLIMEEALRNHQSFATAEAEEAALLAHYNPGQTAQVADVCPTSAYLIAHSKLEQGH